MSGEEPFREVLRRFAKAGIQGIMASDPTREQTGQTSGTDKAKQPMMRSQQMRKSPSIAQQEEECTKFHIESIRIPRLPDYVNPILDDEPIVLPSVTEYQLPVLMVREDVRVITPLLGWIEELRYAYHDLTDVGKFPRFKPDYYLQVINEVITLVTWAEPIYHFTIMNAIRIPHFKRSLEVNVVV